MSDRVKLAYLCWVLERAGSTDHSGLLFQATLREALEDVLYDVGGPPRDGWTTEDEDAAVDFLAALYERLG